jgi:hypothetical protein
VTESEQRFPLEGLSATVKRLAMPESRLESIDVDFALGAAAGRRLDLRSHAALSAGLSNIKVGGSFSRRAGVSTYGKSGTTRRLCAALAA